MGGEAPTAATTALGPRVSPGTGVRLLLLLPMVLLGAACGKPASLRHVEEDPTRFVDDLRGRRLPRALQAGFNVRLSGPGQSGSTTGALVIAAPDRVRINVQTPLSTPLLYLASDGRALHAWTQQTSTFFRGDDALAVLHELTGGAVGVADFVAVLTGRLPLTDGRLLAARAVDGGVQVVLEAPDGARVRAVVDPQKDLLTSLEVGPGDPATAADLRDVWVRFTWPDTMRFEGRHMPEELKVEIPSLGWTLDITFHTWDAPGAVPEVFTLAPPPGATEKDLVTALREMAAKRRATP